MTRQRILLRRASAAALGLCLGALLHLSTAVNPSGSGETVAAATAAAPRVTRKPLPAIRAFVRPKVVRPGDLVTVRITGRNLRNVGAVAFHLVFDPRVLEPVPEGFTEGNLLRRDGARTIFLAKPASTGERIMVGVTRLGERRGARGEGTLCRLTFRALAPEATSVVFDHARMTRPDASEHTTRFVPARVVIRDSKNTDGSR